MRYLFLISHGDFAPGLQSAVEMMVGEKEDLKSASLRNGESTVDFGEKFNKLLDQLQDDDELILMCDILGGSPLTTALACLSDYNKLDKTLVITGMNMPLAITAMTMKDNIDDMEALKDMLLFEGKESISEFKISTEVVDDDDEI